MGILGEWLGEGLERLWGNTLFLDLVLVTRVCSVCDSKLWSPHSVRSASIKHVVKVKRNWSSLPSQHDSQVPTSWPSMSGKRSSSLTWHLVGRKPSSLFLSIDICFQGKHIYLVWRLPMTTPSAWASRPASKAYPEYSLRATQFSEVQNLPVRF